MHITDYFWTIKDIENEWRKMREEKAREGDKGEKVWKKEVRRNFIKILETMKLGQDEYEDNVIAYYKTSDKGDFIFQDNETPRRMQEILELSGKIDLMSFDEKEKLKRNLEELLPRCRTMDEIKKFNEKKSGRGEVINKYRLHCKTIEKMVDYYYVKTRSDFLYQKKLFVEVEKGQYANNRQRVDMYKAQYKCLRMWQISWDAFMNKVVSIRKVERCPAVSANQYSISIENLYENEIGKCTISRKYIEDGINEELSIKDDWRKECMKIVGKITHHDLKIEDENDFDFLIVKAFEELEECMDEFREQYMEKCIPKLRTGGEIRREKITEWNECIRNSQKESDKEISIEDLKHYYDALEDRNIKEKNRRGRINILDLLKNMSESERVELAQRIEAGVFDIYTEFKPLKKQREN